MTSQDDAPQAPSRSGAVSTRRAGRSPTRRAVVPAGLVAVVVAGLAGGFVAGIPQRQGVTVVHGPPDCPAAPSPVPVRREGLDLRIVPVLPLPIGPVGATVCDYTGPAPVTSTGPAPVTTSLPVRGMVLDPARTAQLAGRLDSGGSDAPTGRPGTCPPDDGARVVITFRYAQDPPVQVTVRRSGCRTASNGVRTQLPRPDVLTLIDRLFAGGELREE